jgi:hypothetical protein
MSSIDSIFELMTKDEIKESEKFLNEFNKSMHPKKFASNSTFATEKDLQMACVAWLKVAYPKVYTITSSLQGNINSVGMSMEANNLGYIKGCPDLFLPLPNNKFHGLFIELKNGTKGTNVSDNQKEWIKDMNELGYYAVVIRSISDFKELIDNYISNNIN